MTVSDFLHATALSISLKYYHKMLVDLIEAIPRLFSFTVFFNATGQVKVVGF